MSCFFCKCCLGYENLVVEEVWVQEVGPADEPGQAEEVAEVAVSNTVVVTVDVHVSGSSSSTSPTQEPGTPPCRRDSSLSSSSSSSSLAYLFSSS